MINLLQHNFRPDKFYRDHWVSALGTVCTREEAERLVELEAMKERAKELRDAPYVRTAAHLRELREGL